MAIQHLIEGIEVGVLKNWNISSRINSRATLSITVVDLNELTSLNVGNSIEIINDSIKIFSGVIQSITKSETLPEMIFYKCNCIDNSAIADKRIIAEVSENETVENIVTNLILPILSEEGIIAGNIECNFIVSKVVFNYIKCSEALNNLATLTGYIWYINNDKELNFVERSTFISPFSLTSSIQHYDFQQKSDMKTYRNKQYIRGGRCKTDIQSLEKPTPQPDGISRSFVVRYPLSEKPRIFIDSVEINSSYIGVNGLDEGKKWYFTYNSNIITHAKTETVLTSSNNLEITYTGLRNLFLVVENNEEIENRSIIETGTSGIYENLSKEDSLNEKNQAIDYGNGILTKYGEIKDEISFKTEVIGLEVGQLLTVSKTLFDINSTFLIDSINISPVDADSIEYDVNALDGASIGGWEEFFRNIIKGNREFSIAENEVLIRLNTIKETNNITGETEIKIFNSLYPSETLYPDETLYPGVLNDTITLLD